MAAYVIADITVTDPAGYEDYRKLAGPSVAAFRGRFLVRGGSTTALEGGWTPRRLIVIEFPSAEDANAWWRSEEYRSAREIRARTAVTNMVIAEGAT